MNTRLLIICVAFLLSHTVFAATFNEKGITLDIPSSWGKPEYSQYTAMNKTSEWRFTRQHATLIIVKAECAKCQPFTQGDVDEINKYIKLATSAMLVNHKGRPALYTVHRNPKDVNFRVFKINSNGYQYEIQLGVAGKASHNFSFQIEKEFFLLIDSLVLED